MRSGGLTLLTRLVPPKVVVGALLEFVISPNLRRGISVQGTLNSQRSETPREGIPEIKKVNGGDVERTINECGKFVRIHSGEYRLGTNFCFRCGKSGRMLRDCPNISDQTGGNAQPRPNPQNAMQLILLRGTYSML